MRYGTVLALICGFLAMLQAPLSRAQGVNYIDESGNIFFADSLNEVPHRYRGQIVAPTPTPVVSSRQYKKYQQEVQKAARLKEREKKKKERELAKRQKELLKKRKRALKELKDE